MLLLRVMSAVVSGIPVAGRRQHSLRFGDVFRIQFDPYETAAESLRDQPHRSDAKKWIEHINRPAEMRQGCRVLLIRVEMKQHVLLMKGLY